MDNAVKIEAAVSITARLAKIVSNVYNVTTITHHECIPDLFGAGLHTLSVSWMVEGKREPDSSLYSGVPLTDDVPLGRMVASISTAREGSAFSVKFVKRPDRVEPTAAECVYLTRASFDMSMMPTADPSDAALVLMRLVVTACAGEAMAVAPLDCYCPDAAVTDTELILRGLSNARERGDIYDLMTYHEEYEDAWVRESYSISERVRRAADEL